MSVLAVAYSQKWVYKWSSRFYLWNLHHNSELFHRQKSRMRFSLTLLPVLALTVSAVTPPNGSTFCSSKLPSTTYPNKCEIFQVFNHLNQGNFSAFFANVAPDVEWTLMGTHPLAGVYTNRTIFITDAILRLANTLAPGATANLLSIIGGGAEEWSVQEIHALGVCKNGEPLSSHRAEPLIPQERFGPVRLASTFVTDLLRSNRPQVRQRLLLGHTLEHRGHHRAGPRFLRLALGHQGHHGERVS